MERPTTYLGSFWTPVNGCGSNDVADGFPPVQEHPHNLNQQNNGKEDYKD